MDSAVTNRGRANCSHMPGAVQSLEVPAAGSLSPGAVQERNSIRRNHEVLEYRKLGFGGVGARKVPNHLMEVSNNWQHNPRLPQNQFPMAIKQASSKSGV